MKLFEDLPSINTPITAEALNQIKDKLLVVSSTEPTGEDREKIWIQKGKNLLNTSNAIETTANGVTISKKEDGTLTLNGTCSGSLPLTILDNIFKSIKGKYTFSLKVNSGSMTGGTLRLSINNANSEEATNTDARLFSFVWASDATSGSHTQEVSDTAKYLSLYINKGCVFNNCNISLQLEAGSAVTEYEKYITEKIFIKNNDVYEDISSNSNGQLRHNSNISNSTICNWIRKGNIVQICFRGLVGTEIENNSVLLTLPFAPSSNSSVYVFKGAEYVYTNPVFAYVSAGSKNLMCGAIEAGVYVHVAFTYITND